MIYKLRILQRCWLTIALTRISVGTSSTASTGHYKNMSRNIFKIFKVFSVVCTSLLTTVLFSQQGSGLMGNISTTEIFLLINRPERQKRENKKYNIKKHKKNFPTVLPTIQWQSLLSQKLSNHFDYDSQGLKKAPAFHELMSNCFQS